MGEIISLILAFVSGKAKKISGGTIDNVVTCDANGNPQDSGYSIDDIITSGIFTGSLVNGELKITFTDD